MKQVHLHSLVPQSHHRFSERDETTKKSITQKRQSYHKILILAPEFSKMVLNLLIEAVKQTMLRIQLKVNDSQVKNMFYLIVQRFTQPIQKLLKTDTFTSFPVLSILQLSEDRMSKHLNKSMKLKKTSINNETKRHTIHKFENPKAKTEKKKG